MRNLVFCNTPQRQSSAQLYVTPKGRQRWLKSFLHLAKGQQLSGGTLSDRTLQCCCCCCCCCCCGPLGGKLLLHGDDVVVGRQRRRRQSRRNNKAKISALGHTPFRTSKRAASTDFLRLPSPPLGQQQHQQQQQQQQQHQQQLSGL